MNQTMDELMIVFYFATGQGNNLYTQISNTTTRGNLATYHNKHIGIRWLHECISRLLDLGYVTRICRVKPHGENQWRRIPSLIFITPKGAKHLQRKAVSGAKQFFNKIVAHLSKPPKKRSKKRDIDESSYMPADPQKAQRLKRLTEIVGKDIS